MSLVATILDPVDTLHAPCTPLTTIPKDSGIWNVLVNNQQVHFVGGLLDIHPWAGDDCEIPHIPYLGPNSSRVIVYPLQLGGVPVQIARMGDSYGADEGVCGVILAPKTNTTVFAY